MKGYYRLKSLLRSVARIRHELKALLARLVTLDSNQPLPVSVNFDRVPEVQFHNEPRLGSTKAIKRIDFTQRQAATELQVYQIRQAHITGLYGLILDRHHRLITHRVGGTRRIALSARPLLSTALRDSFNASGHIYDEVYVSHCINSSNYYHWIIEFLSGLQGHRALCRQLGRDLPLLLQTPYTEWQRRTLALAGYPKGSYIEHAQQHCRAEKVYFQTNLFEKEFNINRASYRWLRQTMLANMNAESQITGNCDHIFINRRDSQKSRGINNMDPIENMLVDRGFKSVTLSEYSVDQQISLLHKAKTVIAEHGAGLTNVLFAKDCKIIELFPNDYHNNDMRVLALHGGNQYISVFAHPAGVDSSKIDLDDIERALKS